MTADQVREWLLGGGKIFKQRSGGPHSRACYRAAGADVPADPPPPEVPADLVAEYERNGWLESLADDTMFLVNAKGREALGA
jgi:hypothetical protein